MANGVGGADGILEGVEREPGVERHRELVAEAEVAVRHSSAAASSWSMASDHWMKVATSTSVWPLARSDDRVDSMRVADALAWASDCSPRHLEAW